MDALNWDNLRFFHAIAKNKNIAKAAEHLGVNQTTVIRRLDSFEHDIGIPLFIRSRNNFILTPYGEEIYRSCIEINTDIKELENQLSYNYAHVEKKSFIRVSMPDFIFKDFIESNIEKFKKDNPNIRLSFLITNKFLDPSNNESDIVIRVTDNSEDHLSDNLYGRLIGSIEMQAYSNKECTDENVSWLGWGSHVDFMDWIKKNNYPAYNIGLEVDSLLSQREMMEHGTYAAILPLYMKKFMQYSAPINGFPIFKAFDVWMLTHINLKAIPSIDLTKSFLYDCFKKIS